MLTKTVGVCLFLLAVCLSLVSAKSPNIILLMGDDHGWEETGYNGLRMGLSANDAGTLIHGWSRPRKPQRSGHRDRRAY